MTATEITRAHELISAAALAGRHVLSESDAKEILTSFQIRVPRNKAFEFDAELDLSGLAPPFVLKVMSTRIVHKTEMGGVVLNLADVQAVREAVDAMKARLSDVLTADDGWLVEEMVPQGIEVVVGGTVDPRFGPAVMFGLGGVFVELLADVAFRICPISRGDAREMIDELKGSALLKGWRGEAPVSLDQLENVLLAVGGEDGLLTRLSDVVGELDINPLIATSSGMMAVDARIVLTEKATS